MNKYFRWVLLLTLLAACNAPKGTSGSTGINDPLSQAIATALAAGNGKITICHATGDTGKPYDEITIDANGLHGAT